MTAIRIGEYRPARASATMLLAVLAAGLLLASVSGRAGVQVLDRAVAARLFPVHLHGVPGEAEYVSAHQEPAPFVPGHCHAATERGTPPPGPDQVLAASTLAAAAVCLSASPFTPALSLLRAPETGTGDVVRDRTVPPLVPPPQDM